MRLHSLEITGFGPFSGTQKVDFDDLGADGLFLLHGQTGAGKTTVLDAVAFALYGTVPGSRQDGRRLRSDHAAPGTPTEVSLHATIAGRSLRLRRSPEYMRPKQRGTGETKEQARVTLEWLDGSGENLSRIPDVAAQVTHLLGMSAEQFFQVVLLPQGEFARFLKAETKTRAALLERLFDTGRFGDVEKWFAERRRTAAADLQQGQQSVEVALDSLRTAAGDLVDNLGCAEEEAGAVEPDASGGSAGGGSMQPDLFGQEDRAADDVEPAYTVPDPEEDPAGWAEAVHGRAETDAARTSELLEELRTEAAGARLHADREREKAKAQQRRADALAAIAAFEAGQEARERAAAERDAARRAEQTGWAERARADAAAEHDAAASRRDALAAEFREIDAEASAILDDATADGGAIDVAALTAAGRGLDAELVRLDAAAEDEAALARLRAELESTESQTEQVAATLRELTAEAEAMPDSIRQARSARDQAAEAAAVLDSQATALAAARVIETAALAVPAATTARDDAATAVTDAEKRHNSARSHSLDLRERRLNGMAAELAGELRDGVPCAVCGSPEHPLPAAPADGSVTQGDEDEAARRVEESAEALERARAALHEAETELALQVQRADGVPADEAAARREDAEAVHARTAGLAGGLDDAVAALTALEEKNTSLKDEIERASAGRSELDKTAAGLRARIDAVRERLRAAVGQESGVSERAEHVRTLRAHIDGLQSALSAVHTAETALRKAEAAVDAAAREAGFDDAVEALAAVRPAGRCTEIDRELAAAHEAVASARTVLEEPEVVAVAEAEPADAESAARAAADVDRRLEAAVREQDQARTRLRAVTAQVERVGKAVAALAPLQDRHAWLASLADVMIGDGENSRRMSLRSYVLAARLEEVAVVASQRLRVMSGGRYEFVHTEATVKRERRGGLGLDILDANTGAVRPTSTLSGGETFMASLALALGLADVVSEESGGIHLETLFIDEGFGTLDSETLDVVMGVLDELRDGGRAVGIVSHVAEMRHRIPSRLHVLKGEAGSTLEVTGGAVM